MNFQYLTIDSAYKKSQSQSIKFIDVRNPKEWTTGVIEESLLISLDSISESINKDLDTDQAYIIVCQTAERSKKAYKILQENNFKEIYILEGGIANWIQNYSLIQTEVDKQDLRYQRHHQLKGFGKKAQDKLSQAHVLIVGVGGLGSPAAYYLAAAGIGHITLIDEDVVEVSNLQRQIIHSTSNINQAKVNSAKTKLLDLNPNIKITTIEESLNEGNAQQLISSADVIVDGSDNLSTRYIINKHCLLEKKVLVYAAVFEYEAQITTFDFRNDNNPCLECLFPSVEGFEEKNCSTTGVLGVVPGTAGIFQANETIKAITGVGSLLTSQLQTINLLDNSFHTFSYKKDQNCKNNH